MESKDTCARCGARIASDDPHVWFDIQGTNLGYDPIDTSQLLCGDCYADYREFLRN